MSPAGGVQVLEVEDREGAQASARVYSEVYPEQPVSADEVERGLALHPERVVLLGVLRGATVGTATVGRSDLPGRAFAGIRVVPDARRHGVGRALLARAAEIAEALELETITGSITAGDEAGLAFAERFGFEEVAQEVELVYAVRGDERAPDPPPGIAVEPLGDDEARLRGAYELVREAFPDMPLPQRVEAPAWERWLEEDATGPGVLREGTFVALEDGRVVAFAGLLRREASPGLAEHGLTAVLRSHRGRGLATLLKRTQLAWAAANGLRELVTWTQDRNDAMQAVNAKLGYAERPSAIRVEAPTAAVVGEA